MIGNRGRALAMSDTTRRYVDMFWELLDQILNAVLFVLLGLEVLLVPFSPALLAAGALAIGVALLARLVTVGLPVGLLRPCLQAARRVVARPDLGWSARRDLGRAGAVATARRGCATRCSR